MSFQSTFQEMKNYLKDVKREIGDIRNDERAFAYWFAQAVLANPDDRRAIMDSIVDGKDDKNCDIIFICDQTREVYLCQLKFRQHLLKGNETENDINGLAQKINSFRHKSRDKFRREIDGAKPDVVELLMDAHKIIHKRKNNYKLTGMYVTTGKVSSAVRTSGSRTAMADGVGDFGRFIVYDGKDCCRIYQSFRNLVPAIPNVEFCVGEVWGRDGGKSGITTNVCAVSTNEIRRIFELYGERLFARNIRLDKGESSATNKKILATLRGDPEKFFYLNNGITIVGTSVLAKIVGTRQIIAIDNPQIINGQQTTRSIARHGKNTKAEVLTKFICVDPKSDEDLDDFNDFVRQIVRATNDQNQVNASELAANNKEHIDIYRTLKKLGWIYVRKVGKQTHEKTRFGARVDGGRKPYGEISLKNLVTAMVACHVDPQYMRTKGVESVFQEESKSIYGKLFFGRWDGYDYLTAYLIMSYADRQKHKYLKGTLDKDLANYGKYYMAFCLRILLDTSGKGKSDSRGIAIGMGSENFHRSTPDEIDRAYGAIFLAWKRFYQVESQKDESVMAFVTRKATRNAWIKYWSSSSNSKQRNSAKKFVIKFIDSLA